ncbi:MAG: acyl-CoA dehydratase activase [Candidatus Omnitrophica bacterium]|nr:acyl-CoA dehydratase activase [Candidatus Omnitrophota bacterium]
MKFFLGVDIGSVSVKMAVLNEEKALMGSVYVETAGAPLEALCKAAAEIKNTVEKHSAQICGIGITGSSRKLAALVLGADVIKNEVTAQTVAALHYDPRIATVIEIGGQDSKVILLKDGIPTWHNLNTLCAAGTGSFLASQAIRLGIPIEEFGNYALRSTVRVNIASKCTVFSESDMIHKAALGCRKEDIINGLCEGLARNFINNVARNREMPDPVIFVGGVASNIGVVRAFEAALKTRITVPEEHRITGCVAMALLALRSGIKESAFKGFGLLDKEVRAGFFLCEDCPNQCEITRVNVEEKSVGCFGSRCGKHNSALSA